MGIVSYVLMRLSDEKTNLSAIIFQLKKALQGYHLVGFLLIVLLMGVNWSFEALKWQWSVRRIETLSFVQALQGVLAGVSMGFLSPVYVGDAAGKIWSLRTTRRAESVGALLVSNGFQFYVSLLMGTLAYTYFLVLSPHQAHWSEWILWGLLSLSVVTGMWLAAQGRVWQVFFSWRWLQGYRHFFQVIREYQSAEIQRIGVLALARYWVFSLQFVLMFLLFGVKLPLLDLIIVVFLIYLAKTVIPAFNFLSDLGVREFSALYFFEAYHLPAAQVVSATLTLWVINILVPVVVGTAFIFRLKILNQPPRSEA